MRDFYNQTLNTERHPYEVTRWFSTPERKAAYAMTHHVVHARVVPRLVSGARVLEVGAGPGTWTKELLAHDADVSVDVVDISDDMVAQARDGLKAYAGRVSFLRADFATFQPQQQYDLFFSSRAIEYMPDKAAVAKIIAASLKEGGVGCIVTKYPHYRRMKLRGKNVRNVHTLQVAPAELAAWLRDAGCTVLGMYPVTFVFPRLHAARLDMLLFRLLHRLPLRLVAPVVESYLVVFQKHDR